MKPPPKKWFQFRIALLLCLFIFLFGVIFARAYQLQVLQSQKLAGLAERQWQRIVPLVPKRGILYDRRREELAISVEVDSLFAQPPKIANPKLAAKKIAPLLGLSSSDLQKKMKAGKPFVWLERGITPDQRAAIEDLDIKGLGFLKDSKRFYPQGEVGAHVIGFAGLDSPGLEGIELGYDEFIRGEPGYVLISKDALGRPLTPEEPQFRNSEEGGDIVLTLDNNIQYIAEKELKSVVQSCNAAGGMAVVMDPKTGEILAMAVQPSFDLNRFSSYPALVRRNRVLTDTFEPGSTLKTFLIAAALEEKVATPTDVFFCENGTYSVGGKLVHDIHKYGWLSLKDIVKVSSNIGASKIGQKLGRARLYHYLKSFGFGTKTGIDFPGEVSGFLSSYPSWSEVGLANISFGQGISLTALQLTSALAAIANGGVLMRPYVVKTILDRQGNVLKENQPKVLRRVISPETAKTVTSILTTTVEEGGTGMAAALSGYEAAGKTGTAQKASLNGEGYSEKRVSSFIGFAPADNPKVVISVIIDEPQGISYGGVIAAPVFKGIGEQVLPYLGSYPKEVTYLAQAVPSGKWGGNPPPEKSMNIENGFSLSGATPAGAIDGEKGVMPDFSGKSIRQVLQTAKKLDLNLKFEGSGKAVGQSPAPGQMIPNNRVGVVKFQPAVL